MSTDPVVTIPSLDAHAFRLDGQVAVVTGASKNIGASVALGLAQAGAQLLLLARGEDRLRRTADAIRSAVPSCDVVICAADMARPDDIQRAVDVGLEHFGRVQIVVNNAAVFGESAEDTPILDLDDDAWETAYVTNLLGPLRLTRGFLKPVYEAGEPGCVVNFLSGAGFLPVPGFGPYGASKAALWMMTRYLAAALGPSIRANAVCPGTVSEDQAPRSPGQAAFLHTVPLGRMGRPEEVVGAVLYLVSSAASYTTGEVIFCNGGRPW